jgi:hypothetical protein
MGPLTPSSPMPVPMGMPMPPPVSPLAAADGDGFHTADMHELGIVRRFEFSSKLQRMAVIVRTQTYPGSAVYHSIPSLPSWALPHLPTPS